MWFVLDLPTWEVQCQKDLIFVQGGSVSWRDSKGQWFDNERINDEVVRNSSNDEVVGCSWNWLPLVTLEPWNYLSTGHEHLIHRPGPARAIGPASTHGAWLPNGGLSAALGELLRRVMGQCLAQPPKLAVSLPRAQDSVQKLLCAAG